MLGPDKLTIIGGHRTLSPHFRNSAILRTTKSIAELRTEKSCGTAIADLQNLTSAISQLSAVSCQFCYFLVPFPQLRMVFKINQKYFTTVYFSGNQKLALKVDSCVRFFTCDFFHSYSTGSHGQKYAEICGNSVKSCGLKVAEIRKNCDCGIAELRRLRKCFLSLAELRLRTQKKVARAHLC